MIGKAYLRKLAQPEKAIKQFNETLELIDAGFADTLNLADEIPGLIARGYFEMGDDVRALRLYLEQCRDIEKPDMACMIAHAEKCSHDADTDGITGFMYGAAVSILSNHWKYGELLRKWHNKEYGHEGDGVVNPAVLTIGK